MGLFNQHIMDITILLCAFISLQFSGVLLLLFLFFWCLVLLCCLGFIKILFLFLFEKGVKFQWVGRRKGSGRTWGSRKIWSIYLNLKLFSRMSKTKKILKYIYNRKIINQFFLNKNHSTSAQMKYMWPDWWEKYTNYFRKWNNVGLKFFAKLKIVYFWTFRRIKQIITAW